ncbi:Mite group 2 allergen Pso o 2 [Halotydeus destructor]|nr:Mite group 2 allergen Pso o 2 [Halotydeus destructor]
MGCNCRQDVMTLLMSDTEICQNDPSMSRQRLKSNVATMACHLFKIQVILILQVLVSLSWAKNISFTDCGKGEIQWVDVVPCEKEPCMFKKGTNVTLTASVIANQDTDTAKMDVTLDIFGAPVAYPGIDGNICNKVNCPIVKGKQYNATFYIIADNSIFPTAKADSTWDATGSAGRLFCAIAKVGIIGDSKPSLSNFGFGR